MFDILHEDDQLIVLLKPAGLPTANAESGANSVYSLLRRNRPAGDFIGVVSRLDAAVSGVLVMAQTRAAAADLSRQFRDRLVEKMYGAVVEGRFPAPLGQWMDWHDIIARHEPEAQGQPGRPAHVQARVVKRAGEISLVELKPSTGRRHQLRLQLSQRRCPIVGDRLYGARIPLVKGQIALHARKLALVHPLNGKRLEWEAAWPADWQARFSLLLGTRYR